MRRGAGIPAVLLSEFPAERTQGTSADDPDGIVQRAIREIRKVSGITIITDLCLCEYDLATAAC